MLLTYGRNFVQNNRKMEITYDNDKKQFRIRPFIDDDSETKEMTFTKPVGLVPLVALNCDKTAAGYLAAAGGEWQPDSQLVSIVVAILWVMLMYLAYMLRSQGVPSLSSSSKFSV